ncbi:MAG: glycosyltransferase family 2 protein [Planctomycetes bacterium]|nr:glycosyltransferase family 2 protein [Planctomycetota bacterium]MBM4079626.1 glycosyltransferase family 2 protein [Planctomycetota bacterium]MBM4083554.1 glycosyltransferase family 2 protein [Planctomycetota bacterium]
MTTRVPYSISVFFPVYNDEATVEMLVTTVRGVLEGVTNDWEIILVDDCSPDRSGEIADRLAAADSRVRVIHHEANRGYGGALRSGFSACTKDLIFYTDGDGQYDVKELPLLLERIEEADVVNGWKIKRGDRFYRKFIGRIYHHTAKILFGLRMRDVDCDFRLMRRKVIDTIRLESNSGVICVEMMTKIFGSGFTVVEVPVHHYPRVAGQSQFFRFGRIMKVCRGLFGQWWKLIVRRGKYAYRPPA